MDVDDNNNKNRSLDEQGVAFGRYRLLRKIATGGMAQLYLASMTGAADFQKFCVIKKILPHLAEQQRFVDMFLDEARIAAGLNHPNIVSIFDLGQVGHAYFIAMEYIAGEDLAHISARVKKAEQLIPIELCARIAANICAGLHYAHEQCDPAGKPLNIVHRDVSPQNILLTYEGQVKIVDFGIAKAANKVAHTRTGAIMGKAAYMSPEQCLGQALDRRSDVFAVGVLLHELLTIQRLFKRHSELMTLRAITEEDAPSVRSIRPEVPEVLDEIVATALQRDKDKRYASCLEMRSALEHFIAVFGVPATTLELGDLLEQYFPGHAERRKRIHEAGSLSEIIQALPDAGVPDLGTPSVQSANMLTMTETDQRSLSTDSIKAKKPKGLVKPALGITVAALLLGLAFFFWNANKTNAPATGSLVLTSDPSGALVRLDGQARGHCPISLNKLELGRAYQLELSASGFQSHHANLYLDKQRPNVEQHIALQPLVKDLQASVQIDTMPPGALIFIDNQKTGRRSPTQITDLSPGLEHELRVNLKGYKEERRRFMSTAGKKTHIQLRNEKQRKNKPSTKRHVLPGRGKAKASQTQNEKPAPQAPQAQSAPADSAPGFITLSTKPWTRVYEGQLEQGETPLFKTKMSAGKHRLHLVNKGKKIDTWITVRIQSDEVTTIEKDLQAQSE